jgi:hypothetical protein
VPPDSGGALPVLLYLVHRREELYSEPDRFWPERFLERKFGPHEWLPPRPRAGPRRPARLDLAQDRGEQDLHLVKRERHPEADPVAAPEREGKFCPREGLALLPGTNRAGRFLERSLPRRSLRLPLYYPPCRVPDDPPAGQLPTSGRTVLRTTNGATGRRRRLSRIAPSSTPAPAAARPRAAHLRSGRGRQRPEDRYEIILGPDEGGTIVVRPTA